MTEYGINYTVKGRTYDILIGAKDIKSAKKKIGRKHGYESGRMVKINDVIILGYM